MKKYKRGLSDRDILNKAREYCPKYEGKQKEAQCDGAFETGFMVGFKFLKELSPELIYVRFGELPENGLSKIFNGDEFIGYEKGVSVYQGLRFGDYVKIILPSPTYSACVSLSGCLERPAFSVRGDLVGQSGSDGEILLKNCQIIEKLKL